ncbi:hypothetical protein F5Y10DRAFT_294244 [Nemania abortiva]|nr:hypothetical protein F5Y10DRAFT_294244 [Nemania abortiva]
MDNRESIISWIQGLSESCPARLKKRKLVHEEQHLASPLGIGDEKIASPPKRRRLEGSDGSSDPYATPRAFEGSNIPPLSDTVSTTSGKSAKSGASSPTKTLALLQISGELEIKSFNIYFFPELTGSGNLLESIAEIGRGINILPYCMKSTIEKKVADLGGSAKPWSTAFQSPEKVDNLPGRIPSFEEVHGVIEWAERCEIEECEEAAWNCDVHMALLRKVLGDAKQKINAELCTTARPSPYFKPTSSTGQLIDICIYNSVEQDEGLMNKINRFRANPQTNISINHTDYDPLCTRPLLLSIKTTNPDTGYNKAKLQIGVWHSTQWSFLRWAVSQKLKKKAGLEVDKTTTEVEADTHASLSKLGFIPGIVVHGHQWCLVLSTYDGKKTTLWGEHQFGTTSDHLGAFCAIAGIRRLTAWANDHYWSWFQNNVLD